MCFSVIDRTSFENIKNTWADEVKLYTKTPKLLLVGTKTDLRSSSQDSISQSEGETLRNEIGAFAYVECSAFRCEGVKEVFDHAILHMVKPGEKHCCSIQ
jgi:GTPase SAR1 family protein